MLWNKVQVTDMNWNYGNEIESEPEFGIYTTRSYNNEKLIIPLKCE